MGLFVASVALNLGFYTGRIMPVHSVVQMAESQEDKDFVTALIREK